MEGEKKVYLPLPMSHKLYGKRMELTTAKKEEMFNVPYRSVLELPIYLSTRTGPDMGTTVSMMGRYKESPSMTH